MDKYVISIGIYGCEDVKRYIQEARPLERVEVRLFTMDLQDVASYCDADVIVISSNTENSKIDTIFEHKASYCKVILVVDEQHADQMNEMESIDRYYDVWCTMNPIVRYRIDSFMKHIRETLDYELCEKQLTTLIDSIPDLVWFKDTRGAHKLVNTSFCETVGKTKEQIRDRGHCYIWDLNPAEYEQGEYVCMETEDIVIEEQGTFLFDEKVKIRDEMRQLKTYKSAIVGRRGETVGTVGIAHDVTDIWNTHEEFKTLIGRMPYPIMIVDENYEYVDSNEKFEVLFGVREELKEQFNLEEFGRKNFRKDIVRRGEDDISINVSCEIEEQVRYYEIDKYGIHDMFGKLSGYFYILEDETETYEYEAKLRMLSETDELTKLPNRVGISNFFQMNMPEIRKKQKKFIVYMLDLDYFKQYNDYYGHLAGDKVLQAFAEVLREAREKYDVFVSRFGGEEFMIACTERTADEAKQIAEYIMKRFRDRSIEHCKSLIGDVVSVSIGIAYFANVEEYSVEQMVDYADDALYNAKKNGRNRYVLQCADETN